MKQKLTKAQVRVLMTLAKEREGIMKAFQDLLDAEKEQLSLLVGHYGLPVDKSYIVSQEGEEVFLVEKQEEQGDE